ncbi:MAG: leucyl aminopeptidase [Rhizobiales bacterium]|nr:leucyl aminopeptidase [Hyphomicrobiales bacterium]
MSKLPSISFAKTDALNSGAVVALVSAKGKLSKAAQAFDKDGQISRAIKVQGFTGKHGSVVEVIAPNAKIDRLVVVGIGNVDKNTEADWLKIGGKIYASTGKSKSVTILTDLGGKKETSIDAEALAIMATGTKLRAYNFVAHKTQNVSKAPARKIKFISSIDSAAKKSWKRFNGVSDGVLLARDLVNEPANFLGPVEFAAKAKALTKLGCKVEILDEKKLASLKMGALLSVNAGSARPARVAVMVWNGGNAKEAPVAFVGKGVVFDTGGISIKPSGGMEDMKGDMGGAAAVIGTMHALAARGAKVNAVGIIGLVENMPDAKATRPGDVVTSMSGQTIEVINTDAEGRLVLADLLWYCEGRFKPKFMVDLATLTGAVLVALGKTHAGLFSNDDKLSKQLEQAGNDTNELLWRFPLHADYDKLIDTKNADVKNTGGRLAGSITAAQFLQRFVRDCPWAHLDVAGTAMASPANEYNRSWGSGFGVRLLDRLVANEYEQ